MKMLNRFVGRFRRPPLTAKQPPEPATLFPSRPMSSFLDSLSPEQKAKLRAYRGQESHGEKTNEAAGPA